MRRVGAIGDEVAEVDRLVREPRVRATPASNFTARFPETDEHRRINDEAAARLLDGGR